MLYLAERYDDENLKCRLPIMFHCWQTIPRGVGLNDSGRPVREKHFLAKALSPRQAKGRSDSDMTLDTDETTKLPQAILLPLFSSLPSPFLHGYACG